MTSLPDYLTFKSFPGTPLHIIFSAAGDDLLELLQGLFTFNPCVRYTTSLALKKKYFSNRPAPTPGHLLPRPNCSVEVLKEQQNLSLGIKRKRVEGPEQSLGELCVHRKQSDSDSGLLPLLITLKERGEEAWIDRQQSQKVTRILTVVALWYWSVRMGYRGLRSGFPVEDTSSSFFPVWRMVYSHTDSLTLHCGPKEERF
ncbi:cyclin-dependent kinase 7-like isoform X2 [Mixophyes fleayi]|uniref:cyclin-dependent kinase 7-like isoform X2 n=1 Tax=Mixophyes fleayi TaxID=3061075 RepID=UPI003F4E38E4